jgi:hypothetical protein
VNGCFFSSVPPGKALCLIPIEPALVVAVVNDAETAPTVFPWDRMGCNVGEHIGFIANVCLRLCWFRVFLCCHMRSRRPLYGRASSRPWGGALSLRPKCRGRSVLLSNGRNGHAVFLLDCGEGEAGSLEGREDADPSRVGG